MHAKTALAVAGSVLAVPSAALAATHAPDSDALHPSGKLTHDEGLKDGLVRTNVRLSRRLDRKPRVRRLQTLSVSVLRERNHRLRTRVSRLEARHSALSPGDRRLRVGRQPVDRHRQRVLREISVHAGDLAGRRRHRQPRRRPRGRAGPPRRAAVRAGRPLAVARLRPLDRRPWRAHPAPG